MVQVNTVQISDSPYPDAKLSAREYQINLHHRFCPCFVKVSLTVDMQSCIILENGLSRSLVAKLLQCSSLAVREFCAASEERCEGCYRQVCLVPRPFNWKKKQKKQTGLATYPSSIC